MDAKPIKEFPNGITPFYCYCFHPYDGVSNMLRCNNKECLVKWFHFSCIRIELSNFIPEGKWYCRDCLEKRSTGKNTYKMHSPKHESDLVDKNGTILGLELVTSGDKSTLSDVLKYVSDNKYCELFKSLELKPCSSSESTQQVSQFLPENTKIQTDSPEKNSHRLLKPIYKRKKSFTVDKQTSKLENRDSKPVSQLPDGRYPLYCFCRCPYDEVSDMVWCNSKSCLIRWFHLECVGIEEIPEDEWYCQDCLKTRNKADKSSIGTSGDKSSISNVPKYISSDCELFRSLELKTCSSSESSQQVSQLIPENNTIVTGIDLSAKNSLRLLKPKRKRKKSFTVDKPTSKLKKIDSKPVTQISNISVPLYCYCSCPDDGSPMIQCDGRSCLIRWFHFECVDIYVAPKGKWYCPRCKETMKKKK